MLHFEFVLETENVIDSTVIEFLKTFQDEKTVHNSDVISYRPINTVKLHELLHGYKIFRQETLNGECGKTPQFL